MRVVSRASVVFSLVLIVAIAVGYLGRTSELSEVRDERLIRAAEVGAARVDALVNASIVAVDTAADPSAAVTSIRSVYPEVAACAFDGDVSSCAGPTGFDTRVPELASGGRPVVVSDEELITITVGDEALALAVTTRPVVTDAFVEDDWSVWATTVEPELGAGNIVEDNGLRQTAASVLAAPGTFVVAQAPAAVALPTAERNFYLVVSALGLLLFGLAGTTLLIEQRSLRERATFDALTRLPNRGEFERRAEDSLATARDDEQMCLLLFDLNGFKQINDTHGHQAGDELLQVIGRRLSTAVRAGDLVARWGGDEFVALMPGMVSEEMAVRRARDIAEKVAGRTRLDGVRDAVRVTVSVGIAMAPIHGTELDDLVDAADEAMYRAKRDGSTTAIAQPARPASTGLAVPSA